MCGKKQVTFSLLSYRHSLSHFFINELLVRFLISFCLSSEFHYSKFHSSADRKSSSEGYTVSGVWRYFRRNSPTCIVLRWPCAKLAWVSGVLASFISFVGHWISSMVALLVSASRCCFGLTGWPLHQVTLTLLLFRILLDAWRLSVRILPWGSCMRSLLSR